MPGINEQYNEVITVIVIGSVIFIVLTGFVAFVLLYYQKKKFQHAQQLITVQKEYTEQLLQSKLEIQEQTFNTISEEIHDNVGQILSLAKVQLNIIEQNTTIDWGLFKDAKDNIGKAMTDLRDIAKSLNSTFIQQTSLVETVGAELDRIKKAIAIDINTNVQGIEKNLTDQKKLILFRMIQEGLQNVLKHSKATCVTTNFIYGEDYLTIRITDNGQGFDQARYEKASGLGLSNIINRAMVIGGEASIDTGTNSGTTITIKTPYE